MGALHGLFQRLDAGHVLLGCPEQPEQLVGFVPHLLLACAAEEDDVARLLQSQAGSFVPGQVFVGAADEGHQRLGVAAQGGDQALWRGGDAVVDVGHAV